MAEPVIREAQWSVVLKDVLAKMAWPVAGIEAHVNQFRLLPQWIERQHTAAPCNTAFAYGVCDGGVLAAFTKALGVPTVGYNEVGVYTITDETAAALGIVKAAPIEFIGQVTGVADCVLLPELIQYMKVHPRCLLDAVHAILAPSGICYLTCPDADSDYGKLYRTVTGVDELPRRAEGLNVPLIDLFSKVPVWYYTNTEIHQLLAASKLRVVRFGYSATSWGRHLNYAVCHAE